MIPFEFAAASVPGVRHQRAGKNNQDAWSICRRDHITVAVVTDGCGSGPYSEVGARLGAQTIARSLAWFTYVMGFDSALQTVRHITIDMLRRLAYDVGATWGEDMREIVSENFLFTTIAAVFTEEMVYIAAFGDGAVSLNGRYETWDYPQNAPPYIAYDLIEENNGLDWTVMLKEPSATIETLMIGTDGVNDLHEAAGKAMPGQRRKTIPTIEELLADDYVFSNEDGLRRYLALTAQESTRLAKDGSGLDKMPGLLGDDTTLILARRLPHD